MKKIIAAVAAVLIALVVISLLFFKSTPFRYSGVVEAVEIDVPSRLNEVAEKMHAEEGSVIKKGDTLAEFECKEPRLLLAIAEKEYKRASELLKTNAGSRGNYDLKKHNYDDAALKNSWCKVLSPIDGKVLYKYYREGEFVPAGRKVFTVADMREVDAWFYLPHDALAQLAPGMAVKGYLPETGKTYEGVISVINDEAEFTPKNVQTRSERTRLVYGVKARFINDEKQTLKPGMTLEGSF